MMPLREQVAREIRAEMARQGKNVPDLASALGTSYKTAKNRWNGAVEYSLTQVYEVATWLNVPASSFLLAAGDKS